MQISRQSINGLFIDGKEHDNDPSSFKTAFFMSGRKYERLMNVLLIDLTHDMK
jgi:hypothetical protein